MPSLNPLLQPISLHDLELAIDVVDHQAEALIFADGLSEIPLERFLPTNTKHIEKS